MNAGSIKSQWYNNIVDDAVLDNDEEVKERFTAQRGAINDLRQLAYSKHDTELLREVHTLELEHAATVQMWRDRQNARRIVAVPK